MTFNLKVSSFTPFFSHKNRFGQFLSAYFLFCEILNLKNPVCRLPFAGRDSKFLYFDRHVSTANCRSSSGDIYSLYTSSTMNKDRTCFLHFKHDTSFLCLLRLWCGLHEVQQGGVQISSDPLQPASRSKHCFNEPLQNGHRWSNR